MRGDATPDRQHATKGGGEVVDALYGLRIEGPLISPPMDGDYSRTPAVIDPDAQASKHVAAHRADELVIKEGSGVFADRDQLFKAESMVVEPPAIGGLQHWIMGRDFTGVAIQGILAVVARLPYSTAPADLSQ